MSFLPEGLPIAGGAVLAGVLYAGFSLVISGPLIGDRMIQKMDWAAQCVRHVHAEAAAAQPRISSAPKLGCADLFFLLGREADQFCAVYGQAIDDNPINKSLAAAEDAQRQAQQERMDFAADRASSRCDCAVAMTLERQRVPLALYAGSARQITPVSVRMIESDLVASLNTPACAMKGPAS